VDTKADELTPGRSVAGGLAQRAYEELEEQIVTLQIPPSTFISEMGLSKNLGIGRTPIREALLRLAYEGLVVIIPRRGIFVTEIDVDEHFRMLEFRRDVERLAVRLACSRITDQECSTLRKIATEIEAAGRNNDATQFIRLDQRMDWLIYEAARNKFVTKALRSMSSLNRRFWFRFQRQVVDVPRCATLHAEIAQSVASRDVGAATHQLANLLDYIEEMTHASVGSHSHGNRLSRNSTQPDTPDRD